MNIANYNYDSQFFYEYIPDKIKEFILLNYNESYVSQINKYLIEIGIKTNFQEIINTAIDTLKIIVNDDWCTINIDYSQVLSGRRLQDLINLIEYGNLEIKGYPILKEAFKYIELNEEELYSEYIDQVQPEIDEEEDVDTLL